MEKLDLNRSRPATPHPFEVPEKHIERFDIDTPLDAPGSPEWFDISKARSAIPYPIEISAEDRIKQLEEFLSDETLQHQRANIVYVINMYKTGQLKSLLGPPDRRSIYVCGGQVYDDLPNSKERNNRPVWHEIRSSIKRLSYA